MRTGSTFLSARRLIRFALFSFIFCSTIVTAYASNSVKIAFGNSLIPYAIEKSANGIEVDIIREALKRQGYKLVPVFVPHADKGQVLKDKMVDGVATVNKNSHIEAIFSEPYIKYENVAITLKSRHLPITKVQDLAGLKIAAFQSAPRYLGEQFQQIAKNNPLYQEEAQQINQNRLLYNGNVDVVIVDRKIFNYLDHQLSTSNPPVHPQPVTFHTIFPQNAYQIGFRDGELRDKFDAGLASLTEKDLDEIYARYRYEMYNPPALMR